MARTRSNDPASSKKAARKHRESGAEARLTEQYVAAAYARGAAGITTKECKEDLQIPTITWISSKPVILRRLGIFYLTGEYRDGESGDQDAMVERHVAFATPEDVARTEAWRLADRIKQEVTRFNENIKKIPITPGVALLTIIAGSFGAVEEIRTRVHKRHIKEQEAHDRETAKAAKKPSKTKLVTTPNAPSEPATSEKGLAESAVT